MNKPLPILLLLLLSSVLACDPQGSNPEMQNRAYNPPSSGRPGSISGSGVRVSIASIEDGDLTLDTVQVVEIDNGVATCLDTGDQAIAPQWAVVDLDANQVHLIGSGEVLTCETSALDDGASSFRIRQRQSL